MMMTKTKKGHQGNADPANSGAVARSHANSAATLAENQNQQFESRPSREQSIDDFDMAIRELAYLKWEAAGFPAGDGFNFWLEAERELKANTSANGHSQE
jgi:hypothetical protein